MIPAFPGRVDASITFDSKEQSVYFNIGFFKANGDPIRGQISSRFVGPGINRTTTVVASGNQGFGAVAKKCDVEMIDAQTNENYVVKPFECDIRIALD